MERKRLKKARPRWIALAATFVLAGTATTTSAAAGDSDDALVQEEINTAAGQDAFSQYLTDILELAPASIIDFRWEGDHGLVAVTPNGTETAKAHATKHGVNVKVETTDEGAVPYFDRSTVELAAMEKIEGAIGDTVETADTAETALAARYEYKTDSVVVTAWVDADRAAIADLAESVAQVSAKQSTASPTISVEYEDDSDAPQAESNTRGGMVYGGCTGGFVGKRGSAYGIITAAHCTTKPAKYDGDATSTTYVASEQNDLRFTKLTGGTPKNKFRYKKGATFRTVNSTGIVSVGKTLYKFGKTTNYTHSKVASYRGCVTFTNINKKYCNLYQTAEKISDKGDSGGPWFAVHTAYGVTTGSNSKGSYITPIAYISKISGTVKVKTS